MINKIDISKTDIIKKALDPGIDLSYKDKIVLVNQVLAEIKRENGVEYSNYVIQHYNLGRLGFLMEKIDE